MFLSNDSEYLETLPDEVFFARRFSLSDEDREEIRRNSVVVDGREFCRASVRDGILRRHAAETNPKPGEPGSKENPLFRFGRAYVYNGLGNLVEYTGENVYYTLRSDMKPTPDQKNMIRGAGRRPVRYSPDCPEIPEQRLAALRTRPHS